MEFHEVEPSRKKRCNTICNWIVFAAQNLRIKINNFFSKLVCGWPQTHFLDNNKLQRPATSHGSVFFLSKSHTNKNNASFLPRKIFIHHRDFFSSISVSDPLSYRKRMPQHIFVHCKYAANCIQLDRQVKFNKQFNSSLEQNKFSNRLRLKR